MVKLLCSRQVFFSHKHCPEEFSFDLIMRVAREMEELFIGFGNGVIFINKYGSGSLDFKHAAIAFFAFAECFFGFYLEGNISGYSGHMRDGSTCILVWIHEDFVCLLFFSRKRELRLVVDYVSGKAFFQAWGNVMDECVHSPYVRYLFPYNVVFFPVD